MVARITFPGSVQKALNYNEQKVQRGKATCIGGNGFLLPVNELNFYNKLSVYEHRNALNDRATTKTLHVSLNFSPAEQLSIEKLNAIASDYMQRIGFGDQPYFVYHHTDAGHPHIHVLTSTIRADGSRINTHNIGRNQSELARRFVEEKYGLVKAENQTLTKQKNVLPVSPEKVQYGRSETRRGIANVVSVLYGTYNVTSIHEWNAVLCQYNVFADRGAEKNFVRRKNGLAYRVLDSSGNPIGVPVKASSLPGNPGLKNLEKRFQENEKHREPLRLKLKERIDDALATMPESIAALSKVLNMQGVNTITRVNDEGRMYGITFIDKETRSVFNGSQIGRSYSVAGLLKQMINDDTGQTDKGTQPITIQKQLAEEKGFVEFNGGSLIDGLMTPVDDLNLTPYHLRKKKKRKVRR